MIEIRGVTRPIILNAELVDREQDRFRGIKIVDVVVTGKIKRSEFGMIADPVLVSDDVNLTIRARLQSSEQRERAHTADGG